MISFACPLATWKMERSNIVSLSGQVNNLSLFTSLAEIHRVLLAKTFNVISLILRFHQRVIRKMKFVICDNHYYILFHTYLFLFHQQVFFNSHVKLFWCYYHVKFLLCFFFLVTNYSSVKVRGRSLFHLVLSHYRLPS